MNKGAPIGVFDSGLGGLTVLAAIHDNLPNENLIYFGDTARVPYGSKSKDTVIQYSREIFQFLVQKQVKCIVIACNTASAHSLSYLQELSTVPVIGVIEPAVDQVAEHYQQVSKIAVIGTKSTIRSKAYDKAFEKRQLPVFLFSKACPMLVPLIEEGLIQHDITDKILNYYLNEILQENIQHLILGCTHYPLLKKSIRKNYPQIQMIDSSVAVSQALKKILQDQNLLSSRENSGQIELFVSDITENLEDLKNLFFGNTIHSLNKVVLGW